MALLFIDSFDHYATADLLEKWTTSGVSVGNSTITVAAAGGRRGTAGLRLGMVANPSANANGYALRTLAPADATAVVGFAFALSSANMIGATGPALCSLRDGGTAQMTLRLNSNLTLSVVRGTHGGTVLGTTSLALGVGTAAYLEWKVLVHPSAGTVDVRVNGVSLAPFPLTGQNTRATANSAWNGLALGLLDSVASTWAPGVASNFDFDDLYVLDGAGAAPLNTCLGDVRVDARVPTAPGASTGWTPSAGANWACVDESPPNDDTDSVTAATVGLTDTYTVQDAALAGAALFGVQVNLNMKKMDAGTCTIAPVVRHAGVDQVGAALAPGTGYAFGLALYPTNPGTGAAWVEADFNAAEFGCRKVS